MARVSVVVPAYNAEAFLPDTLASVEEQTYRDWEVIVADDASTDRTKEIAEARGGRFRVVRSEVNKGPAGARNHALAAASGELVAFLDADDLWHPKFLERLLGRWDDDRGRGRRVGAVGCDASVLTHAGLEPRTFMELTGASEEMTLGAMLVANPIHAGALTSRALVDTLGGFCEDLFGTEDYDLWLRIVEAGYELVVLPEALYVYRVRPSSVSSDLPRMARSLQATYRRALDRGALPPAEQRIAKRQLRLQCALEQVGLAIGERGHKRGATARVIRHLPLFVRVAAENPGRWGSALRTLTGRGSPLSQVGK